jgi:hypothetical protein
VSFFVRLQRRVSFNILLLPIGTRDSSAQQSQQEAKINRVVPSFFVFVCSWPRLQQAAALLWLLLTQCKIQ